MTEIDLKQLSAVKHEIELLTSELRCLRCEIANFDGYKGNRMQFGPKGGPFEPLTTFVELLDLEKLLERDLESKLVVLKQERLRLERFLSAIDDAELRLIFRLRHVCDCTWEHIGELSHMDRRTVARKYYKYLRDVR